MIYIVISYDNVDEIHAIDIKDCIKTYAEYTGTYSELFRQALEGCEDKFVVDMYNHFAYNPIEKIYIGEIVYKGE